MSPAAPAGMVKPVDPWIRSPGGLRRRPPGPAPVGPPPSPSSSLENAPSDLCTVQHPGGDAGCLGQSTCGCGVKDKGRRHPGHYPRQEASPGMTGPASGSWVFLGEGTGTSSRGGSFQTPWQLEPPDARWGPEATEARFSEDAVAPPLSGTSGRSDVDFGPGGGAPSWGRDVFWDGFGSSYRAEAEVVYTRWPGDDPGRREPHGLVATPDAVRAPAFGGALLQGGAHPPVTGGGGADPAPALSPGSSPADDALSPAGEAPPGWNPRRPPVASLSPPQSLQSPGGSPGTAFLDGGFRRTGPMDASLSRALRGGRLSLGGGRRGSGASTRTDEMGQIVDRAFRLQGELEDVARQKDDLLRRVDLGPNRDALVEGVWNLMEGIASSIHEAKQEYDRERRAKHIGETFQQALDRQRRRQERAEALRGLAERHMAGADAKRWSKRELRLIGLSLTRSRGEWRRVDWEVAEAAISEARSARGFALHARSRLLDLRKKEYHPKSPKERAAIEKRPGGIDGAETRLFWAQQAHTIAKSELETAKKALRRAHEEGTPAERNAAEAAFWTALDQLEKAEDQARWEAKNLQNLEKGFERLVHAVDSAIQLVDEASSQVEKLALDLKRIVNGLGNKDAQDDASTRLIDAKENLRKELERLVRLLKELENRTRPPDPEPAPPPPDQPPDKAGDPPPPPVTVYGPAIPPELCHLLAVKPTCSSPFCDTCPDGTECEEGSCTKEYVPAPGVPGGVKGKGPQIAGGTMTLQAPGAASGGPGDWQPRENVHFAGDPPVRTPPDGAASGLGAAESAVAPFGSAPVPYYASPDESEAALGGNQVLFPRFPDYLADQGFLRDSQYELLRNERSAWLQSRIRLVQRLNRDRPSPASRLPPGFDPVYEPPRTVLGTVDFGKILSRGGFGSMLPKGGPLQGDPMRGAGEFLSALAFAYDQVFARPFRAAFVAA